ncbi:MAG: ABC transporter ATP-binding protein [Anaerolineaceae bacterium]|nr:ABC transporter ATP-binding protein [Anaerolineaceae bacterium]
MLQEKDTVINTEGLSKIYKNVNALDSLDLKVKRNSIFGFLGPNGAGKTTAIKLLLGLIFPTSGHATIFGEDVVRNSIAIRSRVGYLPQSPRFYEHMTARQILRYAASFYFKGPKSDIEDRVAETLELVGLGKKADRRIRGFSGGELQRVGIGQAQVHYPDLLILDEPAAALDPMGRRDVLEVMERLRAHTTILFSTHILNDVQKISDSVAILNNGKLVAQGKIDDLLNGNDEIIYCVKLKGNIRCAFTRISQETWVSNIEDKSSNGIVEWQISVTDQTTAEMKLLPLLLAKGDVQVINWGLKTYELESVFMNIVEEK